MKNSYLIFGILGLLIIVAVLTNPDDQKHKQEVRNKITSYLQKTIQENTDPKSQEEAAEFQALASFFGAKLADNLIDNMVSSDNYVLFSTTKITWEGETRKIGIGAFGNVYITNKIDEKLTERLRENGK